MAYIVMATKRYDDPARSPAGLDWAHAYSTRPNSALLWKNLWSKLASPDSPKVPTTSDLRGLISQARAAEDGYYEVLLFWF